MICAIIFYATSKSAKSNKYYRRNYDCIIRQKPAKSTTVERCWQKLDARPADGLFYSLFEKIFASLHCSLVFLPLKVCRYPTLIVNPTRCTNQDVIRVSWKVVAPTSTRIYQQIGNYADAEFDFKQIIRRSHQLNVLTIKSQLSLSKIDTSNFHVDCQSFMNIAFQNAILTFKVRYSLVQTLYSSWLRIWVVYDTHFNTFVRWNRV